MNLVRRHEKYIRLKIELCVRRHLQVYSNNRKKVGKIKSRSKDGSAKKSFFQYQIQRTWVGHDDEGK